jgi:hypothetical protein
MTTGAGTISVILTLSAHEKEKALFAHFMNLGALFYSHPSYVSGYLYLLCLRAPSYSTYRAARRTNRRPDHRLPRFLHWNADRLVRHPVTDANLCLITIGCFIGKAFITLFKHFGTSADRGLVQQMPQSISGSRQRFAIFLQKFKFVQFIPISK